MAEPLPANVKIFYPSGRLVLQLKTRLRLLIVFCLTISTFPLFAQLTDLTINSTYTLDAGTTLEVNNLTINGTGKLIVEGTLIVHGNFTMNFSGNKISEFEMKTNSLVLVKGNVHLTNKVSLNLSSYFIVMGNLTKDGAAQQGTIVINDASIYVFGTIDNNSGLVLCDEYDGLTQTNSDDCHAGTETSFEENADDGIIPPYIVELIYECNPPQITNPGDLNACGSLILPAISGSNLSGNEAYFTGTGGTGNLLNPGDEITTSTTLYIYDNAGNGCTNEVEFAVTIYPLPATGEIIPD